MALTDNATNGRIVKEAYGRGRLTLTAACEMGDLLTKAGALADGNSGANKADWVALEFAASGVEIGVAKIAVIGGLTGATLGDLVYLSDTAGGYGSAAGTVTQIVGQALSATDIFVMPNWSGVGISNFANNIFLPSGGVINFNDGDVTLTHAAGTLAFAGADAAGVNGYSFDMAAGTIASEAHGVDVTATGTLASGKGLVGLNVAVTAAGTAGSWLSGFYAKATQASKMVNGYLCAAEFELISTAANASDNSVLVLNSNRNHTGSPPACDPYITLREYGTTYDNVFLRIFGDTGQGAITGGASATLLATGSADKAATCMIRCMFGSTVFWLLGTTTAPS